MFNKLNILHKYVKIDKTSLILGIILSVISSIMALQIPLVLKRITDNIAGGISRNYIFMLIGISLIEIISSGLSMFLVALVGEKLEYGLKKLVWKKVLNLKYEYFSKYSSGYISSRIIEDTQKLVDIFSVELAELITSIITVLGVVIILFKMDWILTLCIFGCIPLLFLLLVPTGIYLSKISEKKQNTVAKLSEFIIDRLENIQTIKLSNEENKEVENGEKLFKEVFRKSLSKDKIQAIFLPIADLIITITIISILFIGAYRVINNKMTAGTMIAFSIYIFQLFPAFLTIMNYWNKLSSSIGSNSVVIKILNERIFSKNIQHGKINEVKLLDINVKSKHNQILREINLHLKPGKIYYLIGESGAGKSTLLNIISGIIQPTSGEIKFNNKLSIPNNKIGYVTQKVNIIKGTIRDNILYGVRDKIGDEQLFENLKKIGLYEKVCNLDQGLDTVISNSSQNLSGGEKQRIAILRVILAEKDILLVDEATSNLDVKNSQKLQNLLVQYSKKKIVVAITHKLEMISNESNVIFMEHGKISENNNF